MPTIFMIKNGQASVQKKKKVKSKTQEKNKKCLREKVTFFLNTVYSVVLYWLSLLLIG